MVHCVQVQNLTIVAESAWVVSGTKVFQVGSIKGEYGKSA